MAMNGAEIKGLHLSDHPLVRSKLGLIRDKNTDAKTFRELVYELGLYIGFQATASLSTILLDKKVYILILTL